MTTRTVRWNSTVLEDICMGNYRATYQKWESAPDEFWEEASHAVEWHRPYDVLRESKGHTTRWFVGAECNICWNALDRHVRDGRGDDLALIYDSAMTGAVRKYTYSELLDEVGVLAAVLKERGVNAGDRVLIYMPMVPEAVIAMLATARIGAVHVVVFGGFAARELATRIEDATPRIVLSASCGLEPGRIVEYKPLLDEAIRLSPHKPECSIIFQRSSRTCELEHERDFDWAALVETARTAGERAECVSVASTDPLYILHTSGTTGKPKGIVRDHGGYAVALKWSMEYVYNVKPGEVFWAASDVGWVVGHSYIVYGPLLNASTTILFEGKPVGTPDAAAFWRVIEKHRVNTLFTAPTAIRAIKKVDSSGELVSKFDLSSFQRLFLGGERADADTIQWAEQCLSVPVIDHWWQTETGWPIAANPLGIESLAVKYGSCAVPMPGYDVRIVDDNAVEIPRGGQGAIVIKLPLPPGCLLSLWEADEAFLKSYFEEYPGYYKTGDAGYIDDKGYIFVMSRVDDIINVAGHRLSTGAIEEVVAAHPDVAECAVIGVADSLKGELPIGLIVLNDGVTRSEQEIAREIVNSVRNEIGPVTAFKRVIVVDQLPKTRSGKILRRTIKSIADSQDYVVPATIDDPQVLKDITSAIAR